MKKMRGQASIIGAVIALVTAVIGITIVQSIIDNQTFTGTLNTIMSNVTVFMGLGVLGLAAGAFVVFSRR